MPRAIYRSELLLVVGLAVVAAIIRWIDLWTLPIFTDEGDEIGLALRIVRDGARPLTNDDPYLGPLFNYLLAGVFWAVGPSPWLPRLVMLVLGTLTVVLAYLLACELTQAAGGSERQARLGGTIAAAILDVNPTHVVVISHVAWGNCLTSCLTTAAAWLFVGAARRAEQDRPRAPATGLWLVLAAVMLGLAFQTHPMVAAFLPAVGLFVLWRMRSWLRTPWPYLAAMAFVLAQAPTLLFIAREGLSRWLAAIHEKQAMYEGDAGLSGSVALGRLTRLLHSLGAVLGGQINDRDTPLAPFWHPAVLLALLLAVVVVGWLWRRRQPLVPLMVLGNVALLPLVAGTFAPLVNSGRYLVPVTIVLLAAVGAWAAVVAPTPGPSPVRGRGALRFAALATVLALLATSAISLAAFSIIAHQDGRTNDRLLISLAALEAAYQPGDVVVIDRAMYRDWTLTEGRLQRVFEFWLETRGIPYRVVDVEDGGRLRRDLADRGGLAVLARRTIQPALAAYDLDEIAGGFAPGAPSGWGYSIVRARLRAGLTPSGARTSCTLFPA